MNTYPQNSRREIHEAILAGEKALYCLNDAKKKLSSAGNWGLMDLFGGNFISGMMKHSKIDEAEKCLRKAGEALKVFRRELGDVNLPADVHIETSDFLTFADFFFDGILADFLVQSRIKKTRQEINDMIIRVAEVLTQLKRMER